MATMTHTAPIAIDRINDVFYVAAEGFATIQSAVDYARTYNAGKGQIIVCYGVSNSESIPALTGGTTGILLTDLRNGVNQNWTWNGTQYVGWVRVGARSAGEDWTIGASSVTSILDSAEPKYAIVVNPPSPVGGVPGWVLLNWDSGGDGVKFGNGVNNSFAEILKDGSGHFQGILEGAAVYAYESFDPATAPARPWGAIDQYPGRLTRIVSGSADATPGEVQLIGFNSDNSANQVWMTGAAGNVDFPTAINFRGPLNFFGASQAKVGGIDGVGHLTAVSADFQNCNVGGSPVRTFANTADAPSGMQWPPAGIGVSTGTAWGASINATNPTFTGSVTTPKLISSGFLIVDAVGSNGIYLNYDSGNGTNFCDGATHTVATIDIAGNASFNGTITAGTKSFRIPHPLDETKDLTHSCLEGPEIAVFYRGEGVTTGGWAEITLPDYFEALTMPEGRTVLLTALFEQDDEPISALAASRVKDGRFKVWSGLPIQKFYWEVKAIRADKPALEVVSAKQEPPQIIETIGEANGKTGTNRTPKSKT